MTDKTDMESALAIAELENYKSQLPMHFYDAVVLDDETVTAAISALRSQSEAERKVERITNALEYAEEGQDFERAISIINRIVDGMTDAEIMEEDNENSDRTFFEWGDKNVEILEGS